MWYVVKTDLAKHRIQTAASICYFSYIFFFQKYIGCYIKEEKWRKLEEERGFVEAKFYTKLENSDIGSN
jgi:hypothetical protein